MWRSWAAARHHENFVKNRRSSLDCRAQSIRGNATENVDEPQHAGWVKRSAFQGTQNTNAGTTLVALGVVRRVSSISFVRCREHVDQRRPTRFAHGSNKRAQRNGAQRKVGNLTAQQSLSRGSVCALEGRFALQRRNAGPLAAAQPNMARRVVGAASRDCWSTLARPSTWVLCCCRVASQCCSMARTALTTSATKAARGPKPGGTVMRSEAKAGAVLR